MHQLFNIKKRYNIICNILNLKQEKHLVFGVDPKHSYVLIFLCKLRVNLDMYTLSFKCLGSVRFYKMIYLFSLVHQGCIYLIKKILFECEIAIFMWIYCKI